MQKAVLRAFAGQPSATGDANYPSMKRIILKFSLPSVVALAVLTSFSGCISVEREVEPTTTTTETRRTTIGPVTTTTVEREVD